MTEVEVRIAAPKLMPFVEQSQLACPGCGTGPNWWDRLVTRVRAIAVTTSNIVYCAGGKPPTETAGVAEMMLRGRSEIFNSCAGVSEPHLHVTCRCCGHVRLMRTKERVGD